MYKSEVESKMKLPLSKSQYEAFEKLAEKDGLTVNQEVQVAILHFFKEHDLALFEEAKKHVEPEVLQVLEKS